MTVAAELNLKFDTSADHVLAELDLVRLTLEREVARVRASRGRDETFDEYSGLYISDAELDRDLTASSRVEPPAAPELSGRIRALRRTIELESESAVEDGVVLQLHRLCRLFNMDDTEMLVLLYALGPDVDVRFDRYYGYLQNDVAKRRPTVQLLSRLLFDGPGAAHRARAYFNPSSRLLASGLLRFSNGANDHPVPFVSRQLQVASAMVDALLGVLRTDEELRDIARLREPKLPAWKGEYYQPHAGIVEFLVGAEGVRWPVYLCGPRGCGKSEVVDAVALRRGCNILEIEWDDMWRHHADAGERVAVIRRDALIHGCIVHVTHFGELRGDHRERTMQAALLNRLLEALEGHAVIVTGERTFSEIKQYCHALRHDFELSLPTMNERRELWSDLVRLEAGVAEHSEQLAAKFRFSPGQIRNALDAAAARAGRRTEGITYIGIDDVYRACRDQSNHGLLAYARRLSPRQGWKDVVLPPDCIRQLHEVCNSIQYRTRVFRDWGFEDRLALGRGLNVLFAGPSGTGKTMSAEIIARELGLDIYKLDVSRVLSRYIGDSERALKRVFDEAQSANCILFIDEADSICGTRTELKSSHDKYANVEANFVLQKIEEHEGIVILATNFRKNLDNALTRRLNFIIEFPLPGEEERRRIWEIMFPPNAPRSADVDLDFMARRFKFTGGNIRNVVLNAAFLAAAGPGSEITMLHLVLAAKREFQKLGKICSKSEFSHYFELVAEN